MGNTVTAYTFMFALVVCSQLHPQWHCCSCTPTCIAAWSAGFHTLHWYARTMLGWWSCIISSASFSTLGSSSGVHDMIFTATSVPCQRPLHSTHTRTCSATDSQPDLQSCSESCTA